MSGTPQFATALERVLHDALMFTSGMLAALNESFMVEERPIRFTGEYAWLGTCSVGAALDKADAALGAANNAQTASHASAAELSKALDLILPLAEEAVSLRYAHAKQLDDGDDISQARFDYAAAADGDCDIARAALAKANTPEQEG